MKHLGVQLKVGYNNGDTPQDSGKIVNSAHYERLCSLLEDHGGDVVYGNKHAHVDMLLKPTVILNPNKKSRLMKEEIFGPILPILTFKHINEAIRFIRNKEKPLVISYFGDLNSDNRKLL